MSDMNCWRGGGRLVVLIALVLAALPCWGQQAKDSCPHFRETASNAAENAPTGGPFEEPLSVKLQIPLLSSPVQLSTATATWIYRPGGPRDVI
jgi:hypothetical protein